MRNSDQYNIGVFPRAKPTICPSIGDVYVCSSASFLSIQIFLIQFFDQRTQIYIIQHYHLLFPGFFLSFFKNPPDCWLAFFKVPWYVSNQFRNKVFREKNTIQAFCHVNVSDLLINKCLFNFLIQYLQIFNFKLPQSMKGCVCRN